MSRCRSFRYLLQPTVRQRAALERLLPLQCELYNAALEERRGMWKWERRSVSYVEQCRTLTELRQLCPEVLDYRTVVCRGTLKRLDRAFAVFYRRCRAGQTPGFPRFKSFLRWDSVQWENTSGWRLDADRRRLHVLGVGDVKLRLHRPLRGIPKAVTVARQGRRWWVTVRCVDVPAQPLPATGREVGIDLGVCALVATSDGELVTEGRYGRQAAEKLARAQQALASKRRASHRRRRAAERVGATHRRVHNQRKDLAHKLSRRVVNDYDIIVHENLKIVNMVRRLGHTASGTIWKMPVALQRTGVCLGLTCVTSADRAPTGHYAARSRVQSSSHAPRPRRTLAAGRPRPARACPRGAGPARRTAGGVQ
jgi:putative transposase